MEPSHLEPLRRDEEFVLYRGRYSVRPDSLPVLLRKFEKMGERRAIAAIEHSIASNYTGLYEPADRHTGQADRLQDSLDEAERRLLRAGCVRCDPVNRPTPPRARA